MTGFYMQYNTKVKWVTLNFHLRCMKDLGTNHPSFVSSLVPDLFVTHPFYAVPEPMIDDPAHVAVAILIFNASAHNPTIISLLPHYASKHYDYFHDSLPKLIPKLKQEKVKVQTSQTGIKYFFGIF